MAEAGVVEAAEEGTFLDFLLVSITDLVLAAEIAAAACGSAVGVGIFTDGFSAVDSFSAVDCIGGGASPGLDAAAFSFLNLIVIVLLLLVPFSFDVEKRIVEASICSSKSSQLLNLFFAAGTGGGGRMIGWPCADTGLGGCGLTVTDLWRD